MPGPPAARQYSLQTLRQLASTLAAVSPRRVLESIAVTFALTLVEGVSLLLLIPLLQLVGVDAGQGPLGGIVAGLSIAFRAVGIVPTLPAVLGVYVGVVALQSLLQRRQSTLTGALQHETVDALRTRVYRAIANAKWAFLARTRSSDFTHLLTDEINRVGASAYCLIDLTVTACLSLAYIALAFRVSPAMTSVVIVSGGLLALVVRSRVENARESGKQLSAASSRLHGAISEHLASMKMAKGYGAEIRHAEIFARRSEELSEVYSVAVSGSARVRQWMSVGSALLLAVIVYIAYDVLKISAASLLLLLFLFARLVPRLTGLYETGRLLARNLPAFAAVMDEEARCRAAAAPSALVRREVELTDRLDLDRVSFDYHPGSGSPAVRDVSLTVAARGTTAIVGPSGAGKSTLADIVMALLEPTAGRVLIDGRPLIADSVQSWRDQIGYVAQETFLFHDTVRANLLWACPGASDHELWRALTMAEAAAFVRTLPQGLDTMVGDRGVLVSGGERQRLSLARALLRRPKLLILDEATSSLDSENERRIEQAIDDLHEQMTIVIITHRLSTIRSADMIHVIDRGVLLESGTWQELVASPSSRFRELCQAQEIDVTGDLVERRFQVVVP